MNTAHNGVIRVLFALAVWVALLGSTGCVRPSEPPQTWTAVFSGSTWLGMQRGELLARLDQPILDSAFVEFRAPDGSRKVQQMLYVRLANQEDGVRWDGVLKLTGDSLTGGFLERVFWFSDEGSFLAEQVAAELQRTRSLKGWEARELTLDRTDR